MKPVFATIVSLVCFLSLLPAPAVAGGIEVNGAWVRQPFVGAKVMAGYMTVRNSSGKTVVLQGARSPDFGSVMMHQTVMDKGMAKMQHQHAVSIAPGKSLVLRPGGYHLMLMQARKKFRFGEHTTIFLQFSGGQQKKVSFPIKRGAGSSSHHHHH